MLNHFQFKLYRHDFQIKFSRCRLMMSHLLKRYASRKYLERRNIENSKLSDAALLALMCLKVQYQVATWRKFCQLVSDVMPSLLMLEYSRFMCRCKNLIPIFQSIRSGLIEISSYGDIAIMDSFPLPLCQDHRKFRAILFQCFADIGYNATKQKYYYGFKVHVVKDWFLTMNLLQPQFMTLRLLQKLSRIVHVLLSLPMWVILVKSSSIFFRKWTISYGRHTVPICGSPNNTTAGNSRKFGAELRAALLI